MLVPVVVIDAAYFVAFNVFFLTGGRLSLKKRPRLPSENAGGNGDADAESEDELDELDDDASISVVRLNVLISHARVSMQIAQASTDFTDLSRIFIVVRWATNGLVEHFCVAGCFQLHAWG